jgi:hypothetical protein
VRFGDYAQGAGVCPGDVVEVGEELKTGRAAALGGLAAFRRAAA